MIEPGRPSLSPMTHGSDLTIPEPDGLIMQITSPFMTPSETPFDTSGSQVTSWTLRVGDNRLARGQHHGFTANLRSG